MSIFGVSEEMDRKKAEKIAADSSQNWLTRQTAAEEACAPANQTATSIGKALNIMASKQGKTPKGLW